MESEKSAVITCRGYDYRPLDQKEMNREKTKMDRQVFKTAIIRTFVVFIIITLLSLIPITALADVLVEPENDFYHRNESDIVYLGRSFIANGTDGYALIMKAPNSSGEIGRLQNDEEVYLEYSCLYDGEFWGFTYEYSGWMRIDQLLVLYDYIVFAEEHIEEFYQYDGDFAAIKETGAVIVWPWPGAGTMIWMFEDLDTEDFWVMHAYKDKEGREWGFVTYLYGQRDIWICLDDPLNSDIAAFNPAPPPTPWIPDTEHKDIADIVETDKTDYRILLVIIALVVALVVGMVVLIKVFWKPKKVNIEEQQ